MERRIEKTDCGASVATYSRLNLIHSADPMASQGAADAIATTSYLSNSLRQHMRIFGSKTKKSCASVAIVMRASHKSSRYAASAIAKP